MSSKGFFVTGTDTEVGKTFVSTLLLKALGKHHRVIGMKPIAAGCLPTLDDAIWQNEDVENLCAASNVCAPRECVNPYLFYPAIAPHIAAAQENIQIEIEKIARAYDKLKDCAEVILVEGAGGLLVPINQKQTIADLPALLDIPVILVVGICLGCINHALLTTEVMRYRGLKLAGWIANQVEPELIEYPEIVATLKTQLGEETFLGEIPFFAEPNTDKENEVLSALEAQLQRLL